MHPPDSRPAEPPLPATGTDDTSTGTDDTSTGTDDTSTGTDDTPSQGRRRRNWPWKPNGMGCGTVARASSVKVAASRTSSDESPASAFRTTESTTPSSSASPPVVGLATKTGSPG